MDVKEIDILGDTIDNHWYYKSKAKALLHFVGHENISTILDIGAGSGFFSKYLLTYSNAQEAWCVDINYDNDFDKIVANKIMHFRQGIDLINADLVLLMDILEHVDDDVALLESYINKVPCGTNFLISVPAFKFLWSKHDVYLEHKRRYTISQIENTIKSAGLKIKSSSYFFGAVFPIAATIRITEGIFSKYISTSTPSSQLKQHHPYINEILATLSNWELRLMKYNRMAGLTAFCLAEKN